MAEWTVVTVIIAVAGLFVTVGTPVIKLNNTISKLIVRLDAINNDLEAFKRDNKETIKRIHKRCDTEDDRLDDHETRIKLLEQEDK